MLPATIFLWSEWSPPLERARLLSGATSGSQIGTVVGMFASGLLATAFGWESIFYCFGILQCLWVIPWVCIARDSPSSHLTISEAEKAYIVNAIGKNTLTPEKRSRHKIPWTAIFKTIPFYVVLVVEFGHNWGFYTILSNLPTYLNNIQHFSLQKNGFLSALPYLLRWGVIVVASAVGDWIRTRNLLSVTATRRIFSVLAFVISAAALVSVAFAGCDSTLAVVSLVIAVGAWGFSSAGYFVAYVEMSPEFPGVIQSIGNTFGTTTGVIAPYVAGVLTSGPSGQTIENWRTVFLIAAGLYLLNAVVYGFFGSAEQQAWDPTGRPVERLKEVEGLKEERKTLTRQESVR